MQTNSTHSEFTSSQLIGAIEHQVDRMVRNGRRVSNSRASKIHPGLTPLGYTILQLLAQTGPSTQHEVALSTRVNKSAISKAVRYLIDASLVTQQQSESDRRQRVLVLTDRAQSKVDQVLNDRRNDFLNRLESWSPADLSAFQGMLKRYNDLNTEFTNQ